MKVVVLSDIEVQSQVKIFRSNSVLFQKSMTLLKLIVSYHAICKESISLTK